MRLQEKSRDLNLDFIRAMAAFLVLSVHFFLNNGYYDTILSGRKMLAMTVVRMAFMVCVPLFLLLTGYLCRKRKLSLRYYSGAAHILLTYLICAVLCEVFRVLLQGRDIQWRQIVSRLLDYSAVPYGWYIEMYLGLFLLIPFLNALYNGLESKRAKQVLVLTLFCMTSLPSIINLNHDLIPEWWVRIYPLTYYMIGAYLSEFKPKLRLRWGLPALAILVIVGGSFNYFRCINRPFVVEDYNSWAGVGILLSTVLLFLLLTQIKLDKVPRFFQWLIGKGAELSLGIYMISWCYDQLFYPILAARVPVVSDRLPWYFAIVPAVYLCSLVTAQLIEWLRKFLTALFDRILPKKAAPTASER